jgi:hypothetical protein
MPARNLNRKISFTTMCCHGRKNAADRTPSTVAARELSKHIIQGTVAVKPP